MKVNSEYLYIDALIKEIRKRNSFSDFSCLVTEILDNHCKWKKTPQKYLNEIHGEIVPLNFFASYMNAQFVELCPENAKFDGKVYLEGGTEAFLEITQMGHKYQSALKMEHSKKYGMVDLNVNVKRNGTKASGNRVKEQADIAIFLEEEIKIKNKRRFKDDLKGAIRRKTKKSDNEDFDGWLLVSFNLGDYTLSTKIIKELMGEITVSIEGFSKIYVVGSPWADYESLVYEIK